MSERKAKPLRTELTTCFAVTACGLNMHKFYLPDALWARLLPVLTILVLILCVVIMILDWTKGTEAEIEREERDERNLMILDRASWFCWRAENVLLIVAWAGFTLFSPLNVVCYVLYWIIILRYWLLFVTRWWMNRKY